jgi:hypothetical protein
MVKPYRFKHRASILIILAFAIFSGTKLSAQCIPDTANCEDIGDPGQICPNDLPSGVLNVIYDEVITIIPPGSFDAYVLAYIVIDSVKNLPPGIDYFPNADIFFPDTAYCIQLSGTPTQVGDFTLAIYISPFIDVLGTPTKGPQVVDDSSLVVTIQNTSGIEPNQMTEFMVFQNFPNPFSEVTRLAYYTPIQERIELSIYNILGVLVHQEKEWAAPGKHNFNFDGKELQPGTYLYRIKAGEAYYSGKIMKSR